MYKRWLHLLVNIYIKMWYTRTYKTTSAVMSPVWRASNTTYRSTSRPQFFSAYAQTLHGAGLQTYIDTGYCIGIWN